MIKSNSPTESSQAVAVYNKKIPCKIHGIKLGTPSGTRTQDPLIKSQLLYQLS